MKCNTKNRPLTPEQEERQRKHNIRNNEQYLNYISRCLMLSVRNNAGFGAVRLGLRQGCGEFLIYGSLDGPRLDHTVANFQTLQFLADHGAHGYLIGNTTMVTVVKNGKITFPAGCAGTISVFCMGPDAEGVTEKGLFYGVEEATLTSGFPLGVSNHFTGEPAEISVKNGSLLVLWEKQNGFPDR